MPKKSHSSSISLPNYGQTNLPFSCEQSNTSSNFSWIQQTSVSVNNVDGSNNSISSSTSGEYLTKRTKM